MGSDYRPSPNIVKTSVYLGDQAGDHAVITGTLAIDGKVGIETHAPNATLQVSGSISLGIQVVTESVALAETACFVLITTANAVTITLPSAPDNKGRMLVIKDALNRGVGDGAITVQADSGDEMNGFANGQFSFGPGSFKAAINLFAVDEGWHMW
tara:strand:+ start:1158 stop:1622 length:465 start_codon:yes stop_codon:yes gene_type:complete